MDRNFFIQLTNNLYRLTLLFPKKEPLRYKMRELAASILSDQKEKDFEVLDSFFEVAKKQDWVKVEEILAIQKEYDNLKAGLENPTQEEEKISRSAVINGRSLPVSKTNLPGRQEKIMEILKERGQTQVWEVKQILAGVSKRTLRRDFEQMLNKGIIKRIGERNNTFYQPVQQLDHTEISRS